MSLSFSSIADSFRALADSAAHTLARESLRDVELRAALQTVQLGPNAVRIGDWDILARDQDEYRAYDIRCKRTGNIVVHDLPFYEAARQIVSQLNEGICARSAPIMRIVNDSQHYNRLRWDIEMHAARVQYYYDRGEPNRAAMHEDRLSAIVHRANILRDRLETSRRYA